jgi:hypothetical protein
MALRILPDQAILPERRDRVLERRGRCLGRLGAVDELDEPVGRDNPPRREQQNGEEGTLPLTPLARADLPHR